MQPTRPDPILDALRQADNSAAYNELTVYYSRRVRDLREAGQDPQVLLLDVEEGGDQMRMVTGQGSVVRLGHGDLRCFTPLAEGCPASRDRYGTCHVMTGIDPDRRFDLVVCCHSISFLAHPVAACLLANLKGSLAIGGNLLISALGLYSSTGEGYPDADLAVEERFAEPESRPGSKLCLYKERDLFLTLAGVGWGVVRTATTSEGNVLAVAVRI